MIKAQLSLYIGDFWILHDEGKITLGELASKMSDSISVLPNVGHKNIDAFKDQIVSKFRKLSQNPNACEEDFDEVLEQLYEWADMKIGNRSVVARIQFYGEKE